MYLWITYAHTAAAPQRPTTAPWGLGDLKMCVCDPINTCGPLRIPCIVHGACLKMVRLHGRLCLSDERSAAAVLSSCAACTWAGAAGVASKAALPQPWAWARLVARGAEGPVGVACGIGLCATPTRAVCNAAVCVPWGAIGRGTRRVGLEDRHLGSEPARAPAGQFGLAGTAAGRDLHRRGTLC